MNTGTLSTREMQKTLNAVIMVDGQPNWLEELGTKTQKLRPVVAPLFGGRLEVPYLEAVTRGAELNDVSFERELLSDMLTDGYSFAELEIEVRNREGWGKMVWYPEHPNYSQPPPDIYKEVFESKIFIPPYYFATFKTENAGDQEFCIYSTQMFMARSILLHKTILYHKVVLNPPLQT